MLGFACSRLLPALSPRRPALAIQQALSISTVSAQKVTKKRLGRKNAVVWRWYRYLFQHDAYRSSAAATFAQISLPTNESEFGRPRYSPKHGHKDDRDLQKERKSKTFLSDDTVDTLLEKIADLGDSFLVDRDSLIGAYEAGCGLRAIGISHIRLSALSSALARRGVIPKHACILRYAKDREAQAHIRTKVDQISELGGHGIFISVVEKASKTRDVLIETALIHQTLDFVWKYHKNWRNKLAPREAQHGHLFLSLKTGQGLLPATVSDIMKRYFNRFGLDGSGHDLRRNKITRRALELVQKSKRRDNLFDGGAIEVAMADEFGHSDFKTMGPYVNMGRILDTIADEVEEHYER